MQNPYYATTSAPHSGRAIESLSPSLAQNQSVGPSLAISTFHFSPSSASDSIVSALESHPRMNMANHQPIQQVDQPLHQSDHVNQQSRKPQVAERPSQQEQQPSPPPSETTSGMALPSKDVSEDNIDSAYAEFILYCNPSIPRDVDTEELKRGFRNPPRSDGNVFSPWALYLLLQKLDRKEIKTWAHLVTELGVEPPDPEKNQSAQKVQQYAVRLKRWLHAYHIDSFFNYLASKPSTYYTDRPVTDTELAETVREGVPPEEDLAVRALLPEWRPKRGRRKADDSVDIDTPSDRPGSSEYSSVYENQYSSTTGSSWSGMNAPSDDVWAAAQIAIAPRSAGPSQQQQQSFSAPPNSAVHPRAWKFPSTGSHQAETPSSAYPPSAGTPSNPLSAPSALSDRLPTPQSSHPGSRSPGSTKRKRHAPAISSAWNQGTSSGKIRGRPPSNRSIQDGPFGTFPVNPNPKDAGTVQNITASGISTVLRQPSPARNSQSPPTLVHHSGPVPAGGVPMARSRSSSGTDGGSGSRKPSKLQLQVPQHQGGPIRLATPPRVLVNGESQLRVAAHGEQGREYPGPEDVTMFDARADDRDVDWKRQCFILTHKLQEKEEELKRVRRAVLDAVM